MGSRHVTVVVGNGPAAVHACRALRARGYLGRIHLFSDHSEPAYSPMLTSYYLAGRLERTACFPFGGRALYHDLKVDAHLANRVTAIDAEAHTVRPARGPVLTYDQCLVATGSSPVLPPIPGLREPGVFTLRTMDDADRLLAAVNAGARRALVLGSSLVGLKAAEALRERGLDVVLTDVAERVLPLAAAEPCARLIEGHLAENGIDLRLGDRVRHVQTRAHGLVVEFDLGAPLPTDLLVVAAGVRPNLDFVDPAQVQRDVGLIVDDQVRTSAPDLYAAGDVAQATSLLGGGKQVIGLWANACLQGRTAGRVMAGDPETYPGSLPCNVVHLLGLTFAALGDAQSETGFVETEDDGSAGYCRLVAEQSGLVGANLLNVCTGAGVLRQAISRGARGTPGRAAVDMRVPQRAWAALQDHLLHEVGTQSTRRG